MTTDEIAGKPRVPKEELEELVEEYRTHEREARAINPPQIEDTYRYVAKELEVLIERYDNE